MLDIIIKNGCIVDGTGKSSYHGDLGIRDGKIVQIESNIDEEALEIIDATDLVVSPGFIDVHSHNDLVPFMEDNIQNLKLMQGVTTELIGQCGLGVVPCVEDENNLWKNYIRGVVGDPGFKWKFSNINDYINGISKSGLKNNYTALISHGAIRTSVMVHLRNHDDTITNALEEMIYIAQKSKVRLHISHMRSYNSKDLGCDAEKLISYIESAVAKGIKITFDEHLYLSGSTLMTQLLPPCVTDGGSLKMFKRLKNIEMVATLKEELKSYNTHYLGWDNYSLITGWDGILITSVKQKMNLEYVGKTVGAIAKALDIEAVDFALQLLITENFGVGVVTLDVFSEEDTIKLINHPLQMVGSDSIPAGNPHPRLYGNFPLFIGKFVRDKKALSLENAIYKITYLPAKTLGLKHIGELAIGKTADIVLFDLKEIMGFEDYFNPTKASVGVKYVILNGKVAVRASVVSNSCYGKVYKFI